MLAALVGAAKKVTCKKSSLGSRKNMSNDSFSKSRRWPAHMFMQIATLGATTGRHMVIKPRGYMQQQAACANTQLGGKSGAFLVAKGEESIMVVKKTMMAQKDVSKDHVHLSPRDFPFPLDARFLIKVALHAFWFCSKFATGHCLQSARVPFDGYGSWSPTKHNCRAVKCT